MSLTTLKVGKAAQALADEHGVDLSAVTPTGIGGLITQGDVQKVIDAQDAPAGDDAPKNEPAKKVAKTKYAAADDVNASIAGGTIPSDLEADAAFYCPGCGKRHDSEGECVGSDFGHPPIAVVSTAELAGDPAKLTAAPDTD